MIAQKIESFIRRIIQATEESRIRWESLGTDEFATIFSQASVRVKRSAPRSIIDPQERYQFELLNEQGTRVEYISLKEREEGFEILNELFNSARRNAFDIDDVLRGIDEELDR